ncbi:MAG: hypothetical protein FH756_05715 [Firmicutes bacterium]|nr:hypothetical protein [Bacillota bacterium]
MSEKHSLESFISDIEKIVSGDTINPPDYEHCDEEYKDLLSIAQMLTNADYSTKSQRLLEKIISRDMENGEVDDDLDMVAGGLNLNDMSGEKGKKNGI